MQTLAFVIIALIAVVLLAGAFAKRRLRRAFPPPGRLLDVGGYRLHIHALGSGGPTVVFDTGLGEPGLSWAPIQREIAEQTTAVMYDRAGLGWSDPGPKPRTASKMVEELHILLQQAGVPQPYILVGASLGGLLARFYAHRYPQEVAGLVLVDAAHEEQYTPEPLKEAVGRMSWMMPLMTGVLRIVTWLGLPALLPKLRLMPAYLKLPPADNDAYGALLAARTAPMSAQAAEMAAVLDSHAQVREARITSLGDLPLVVLRHGLVQPQMKPELTQLMEETNVRLQAEVAAQSTRGKLMVAGQSSHAIAHDQPELVVAAIQELLALARQEAQPAAPQPAPSAAA